MNNQDDKQRETGTMMWLPLVLLPVLCCAAPLLIAGIASLGVAAILRWFTDPWIQAGAIGLLAVGLAAWWRRRIHQRVFYASSISDAPPVRTRMG